MSLGNRKVEGRFELELLTEGALPGTRSNASCVAKGRYDLSSVPLGRATMRWSALFEKQVTSKRLTVFRATERRLPDMTNVARRILFPDDPIAW